LRKDLQKKDVQKNSKVLDDIISSQNPHHDKFGLGYNQTKKGSISKEKKQETYPKSYAKTIKENRNTYKEDYKDTPPSRRLIFQNQRLTETNRPQEEEGFIKVTSFRRS
jgi:hypothetical protein